MTDDAFTVDYRGEPVVFVRCDRGWAYKCPAACCSAFHWIETESGTRHKITSTPGAPVTIVGSLGCACKKDTPAACRWHVVITNGIAKDA